LTKALFIVASLGAFWIRHGRKQDRTRSKGPIVTSGQQLFEQGRKQGIQQMLLRQLGQRFGAEVDPQVEQRITTASVEQIEIWSGRVLTAATLGDLLAD
jgi:hypothetical protein